MTFDAKKKIGIVVAIVLAVFVLPFLIFRGSGPTQQAAQITLTFWNLFDEADLYSGLIEEFHSLKPEVNIRYKKYTDIAEFESDFINELAEGKGPDIVAIPPAWLLKHKGKLAPMPKGVFTKADPESYRSIFIKAAGDDLILPSDAGEDVYAIPVHMETLATIYNSDLLLDRISKDAPAADWDTFVSDAIDMASRDSKKTRIIRGGLPLGDITTITRGLEVLHVLMLQQGVSFYDPTKLTVTLAQPTLYSGRYYYPASDAVEFFLSFTKKGSDNFLWDPSIASDFPEDKEVGAFARGEIATFFGYAYQLSDVQELIAKYQREGLDVIDMSSVRAAALPQLTNATTSSKSTLVNYYPLAVTKNSTSTLAAWDFIDFLSGEQQQRFLFNKGKKLSARTDMLAEQSKDLVYGAFARQAIYAKSIHLPFEEKLRVIYTKTLSNIGKGVLDPTDGLADISAEWQCLYNKAIGREGGKVCG